MFVDINHGQRMTHIMQDDSLTHVVQCLDNVHSLAITMQYCAQTLQ